MADAKPSPGVLTYLYKNKFKRTGLFYEKAGVRVSAGSKERPWWTVQRLLTSEKRADWFIDIPREVPDDVVIGVIKLVEQI